MKIDLNRRYDLNPAHSEVVETSKIINPCNTLDMGCSNGRNALYLSQHGFSVTAIDINPNAISMLQGIINKEKISNIKANLYDINSASLDEEYGFISCTVTLMFIDPASFNAIIADMHKHTLVGGYNLIVCAMNTDEFPCSVPFPFTLATDQLREIYEGWEILKYNEDVGTMHNGAQLQFATILAKKLA
jgi:tellurite methyltransferase